jgi:hypothetical protein
MKTKSLGILLVVAGLLMMIYTGFKYVTTEKVVDIGAVHINREQDHFVHWSPIVGTILLVGGISILAFDRKASN